jgi:hypothetical protein
VEERHHTFESVLMHVSAAIPTRWRRAQVDRAQLDRFLFGPDDLIVAVGQDGLVANLAKYLRGQPVVGVDAHPGENAGVLARHRATDVAELLDAIVADVAQVEERTMVAAEVDGADRLLALTEVFVGHSSHQSARYLLRCDGREERQSSSGLIVTTGTGATGWARSVTRDRAHTVPLPQPDESRLAFFVREAWPSARTGTDIAEGVLGDAATLEIVSEMDDGGVVFGDGIEADRVEFSWGRRVRIGIAAERLRLVRGAG